MKLSPWKQYDTWSWREFTLLLLLEFLFVIVVVKYGIQSLYQFWFSNTLYSGTLTGLTIAIYELAKLAKEYRKCIINSIQVQPAEKFTRQYKDAQGNNNFVIENYLKDFIWHDQHHMKQIAEIGKKSRIGL